MFKKNLYNKNSFSLQTKFSSKWRINTANIPQIIVQFHVFFFEFLLSLIISIKIFDYLSLNVKLLDESRFSCSFSRFMCIFAFRDFFFFWFLCFSSHLFYVCFGPQKNHTKFLWTFTISFSFLWWFFSICMRVCLSSLYLNVFFLFALLCFFSFSGFHFPY